MDQRRAAYFQGLGIHVWVRRRPRQQKRQQEAASLTAARSRAAATPPAVSPRPTRPAAASQRAASAPPRHRQSAATDQAPQAFRIRCFRYGRVFVALAEDAWPLRRYLLDVAKAMNGFGVAQRKDMVFEWPQPGADANGGGRAFRAFAGHQTRNGERVLISGRRVLELLGGTAEQTGQTGMVDGRVYVVPEPPDAEAKKHLWTLLRELED